MQTIYISWPTPIRIGKISLMITREAIKASLEINMQKTKTMRLDSPTNLNLFKKVNQTKVGMKI